MDQMDICKIVINVPVVDFARFSYGSTSRSYVLKLHPAAKLLGATLLIFMELRFLSLWSYAPQLCWLNLRFWSYALYLRSLDL